MSKKLLGIMLAASLVLTVTTCIASTPNEPWKNARYFDAIAAGKRDVIEAGIKAGLDPNAVSPYWGSLLKYAAANGHLDIVKLLLAKGADLSLPSNAAVLLGPVESGRFDIVKCLVEAGAIVRKPKDASWDDPMVAAAIYDHREILDYLLKHGGDPDGTSAITAETALQVAAAKGDTATMQLLLAAGADIDHRDFNGMSALMHACQHGQRAAVALLLSRGANASFKDGYDRSAGDLASQSSVSGSSALAHECSGSS